ncbi:Membrane protein involved in the export of O-antigen and teichoic acid [Salinimicrobium sediminis]|uniref:Membrane protein involved in the export of O-antigen and teichoic acid n=1 Tax=Salinimicrobium sediminis TaxID=1343891 RepID=A0A285X4U6_9FLAO|nr:lipopolysaccharide biosynthesis protein [Salinimicrobium sediminis]SOC80345.1 Membrane protein involved in the export of O-antigen and teichoic acid [Salinimicrobium sediminis]
MALKKVVTSGLVWTFTQQFGNQIIGFIVSLILARLLLPAEFGLIAMIAVFVAVGNGIIDSGLSLSIIRDTEADEKDFSTVFIFNVFAGLLIYTGIFFSAPLIAEFYKQDLLTNIIRVYCLTFIFSAATSVHLALFTRDMKFKVQTLTAIPAALIGGALGIFLAIEGFGVWSLVYSSLLTSLISAVLIWKYSHWFPSMIFKKDTFIKHWNYGYKLGVANLLNRLFNNLYLVVIGKFFSPALLGFYSRAESTKQLPLSNIERALNKVSFPMFVGIKDDPERLKSVFRKLLKMVLYIVSPVLMISAALADPLFRFLFTEKWLPAVPFFQILCLGGLLLPLHSYNLTLLNIYGRSDLFLKLEIVKKILIVVSLLLIIPFGIYGLLWGQVVLSLVAFFINAYYTQIFITYPLSSQLRDVFPVYFITFLGAAIVFLGDQNLFYDFPDFVRLMAGGFIGLGIYFILSVFGRFEQLPQLKDLIREHRTK